MMKVTVAMAKKVGVKGFKVWAFELINTTPEELAEDDLIEINTSQLEPDDEKEDIQETMPENKLTLTMWQKAEDNLITQDCLDFLYNVNPPIIQAVILKKMVEEISVPCRNMFREMKKQKKKSEIMMHFCKLRVTVPAFPASPSTFSTSSSSASPETDPSSSTSFSTNST